MHQGSRIRDYDMILMIKVTKTILQKEYINNYDNFQTTLTQVNHNLQHILNTWAITQKKIKKITMNFLKKQ